MTGVRERIPLVVSGDLHACALGRVLRSGDREPLGNPFTTVLSGPIGTATGGWPSAFRGVGSTPPAHLDVDEVVEPVEEHGFTLADFLPDRIVLRMFR